jgi:hypothetical protein
VNEIEIFFSTYKNTAMAFYSFVGFIGVMTAVIFRLRSMYNSRIDAAKNEAKTDQRHEFQAGYFDIQENRYDRLLDKYDELKELMLKHEINHIN